MISPRERPIFHSDLKFLPPSSRRRFSLSANKGITALVGLTTLFLLVHTYRESTPTTTASSDIDSLEAFGPIVNLDADGVADYKAVDEQGSSTFSLDLTMLADPARGEWPPNSRQENAQSYNGVPKWEGYKIRTGDTLSAIFARAGLDSAVAADVSRAAGQYRFDRKLHVGKPLSILKNTKGELHRLKYALDARGELIVERDELGGYRADYLEHAVESREQTVQGTIRSTLSEAAARAGLPRSLIPKLAAIFRDQVNFSSGLHRGDNFTVIYRDELVEGRKLNEGPILAAEFNHKGGVIRAIRYQDKNGYASYYTPEGENLAQGFSRTPVRGASITSRFGSRLHPLRQIWRKHRGVDYAAPTNTPILATGDGVVKLASRKGGYGKTIIIRHSDKYSTLYAHLNGYKKGVRSGARVKKGDVIGYVGSTGISTGPHLHYEFQINDKPKDPLKVKLPLSLPIAKAHRRDFMAHARAWEDRLATAGSVKVARSANRKEDAAVL